MLGDHFIGFSRRNNHGRKGYLYGEHILWEQSLCKPRTGIEREGKSGGEKERERMDVGWERFLLLGISGT